MEGSPAVGNIWRPNIRVPESDSGNEVAKNFDACIVTNSWDAPGGIRAVVLRAWPSGSHSNDAILDQRICRDNPFQNS